MGVFHRMYNKVAPDPNPNRIDDDHAISLSGMTLPGLSPKRRPTTIERLVYPPVYIDDGGCEWLR
jgi:hypothetical protein